MSDTYVPSQPKNVVPLDYLNTQLVSKQNQITVNANKNTAQDARLDALEAATTTLPARMTAVETKNTEQDTRLGTIESKDVVQDTDIAGLKTRMTAVESNQSTAATYKSAVRK